MVGIFKFQKIDVIYLSSLPPMLVWLLMSHMSMTHQLFINQILRFVNNVNLCSCYQQFYFHVWTYQVHFIFLGQFFLVCTKTHRSCNPKNKMGFTCNITTNITRYQFLEIFAWKLLSLLYDLSNKTHIKMIFYKQNLFIVQKLALNWIFNNKWKNYVSIWIL